MARQVNPDMVIELTDLIESEGNIEKNYAGEGEGS